MNRSQALVRKITFHLTQGTEWIWHLAAASSFQPWYLSVSYWMSHITTQSPELESPQPSRSLPSARFIKPRAESALHTIFIFTVSEETCITPTQPTALQTLKIMMKVVNPVWEPPKRGALGRLVPGSVQCRHGEEWGQSACTSEQGGETGCTQRQQGRYHLTAEMQEGRGSSCRRAAHSGFLIYMTWSAASLSTMWKVLLH